MNNTFLLFEDGSHYTVFCTPYPMPPGTSKPVDAYILTEPLGDFTIAAQKAVHAVFAAVLARDLRLEPVNAGFDLAERVGHDADITGRSGGLAFAVAFAGQVLETDPCTVAATGEVQGDGRITGVAGIEQKLTTAVDLLATGDTLLFPEENLDDIPSALMTRLREKGIKSVAVSQMDEVIDVLLGESRPQPARSYFRLVLLILLLLAALALAVREFYPTPAPEVPAPVFETEAPLPVSEEMPAIQPEPHEIKPETTDKTDPVPVLPPPVIEITPVLSEETTLPVAKPAPAVPPKKEATRPATPKTEKQKPTKSKLTKPKPTRPKPAVTPPLPPAGPEGDKGFE